MRFEPIKTENPESFRRLTGGKGPTLEKMMGILREAEAVLKARRSKPAKWSMEDLLLMTLEYLREYRTCFPLSRGYGVSESACYRTIRGIENTLIKPPDWALPGRKTWPKSAIWSVMLVLLRPQKRPFSAQKRQRSYYSSKKKRHTLKTPVIVGEKSSKILCTAFSNDKKHDFRVFRVFRESQTPLHPNVKARTDSEYQGLHKRHSHTELPKKKGKKTPLFKEEKRKNRHMARERVRNEPVIGRLKRFKIITDKYRNRRKRFGLKFNLIMGIYNMELE